MSDPSGAPTSDRPDTSDVDTEFDPERVVVRDKRRYDPVTGAARGGAATPPPAGADAAAAYGRGAETGEVQTAPAGPAGPADPAGPAGDQVAELTGDLQRLSAEYANYRKRVARDQAQDSERIAGELVARLLPLLDDVDRARDHGDLEGAFRVVGEGLEAVVAKAGVERFGAAGDAFDPQVHEAVMSAPEEPGATVATCVQVFSPGYRLRSGRVLRAAKVVVAEPGAPAATVGGPGQDTEPGTPEA